MHALPVPGIILAAGKSRRMGDTDKLLLIFEGKPLLQHVIDAAVASALSPVLLVTDGKNNHLLDHISRKNLLVVSNGKSHLGYSTSLQAGLHALPAPCAGVMFLLGDQPLVKSSTIDELIGAFQHCPTCWVAPSYKGKRGNPVITPSGWFAKVHALRGDTGPRKHLNSPEAQLQLVNVDDRGVVFDVDSPEDYSRLCALSENTMKH